MYVLAGPVAHGAVMQFVVTKQEREIQGFILAAIGEISESA